MVSEALLLPVMVLAKSSPKPDPKVSVPISSDPTTAT